ncbi:polyprenyl synthetase family protein [Patescibacteria group bacterium]|nr:polyprenyl synthetase family protein [Patescibacteria group bacterium]
MTLNEYFALHSPRVTEAIQAFFATRRTAAEKLSPHLVQSIDVLEEFSLRGGKRVRSMLVLMACQLAGGELNDAAYQVAAAVELFHKHILNLDDMADRDELRNGGPTIWKRYQQLFEEWKDGVHHARSFTEIDGTLLGSFAFEMVREAKLSAEQRLAVMDVLNNQMYFETVAGWQIHYYQNQEPLAEADEEEFIKGLDLVTARYTFVGPLKIGLIIQGKADSQLARALEAYGMDVGLAFQVTDDILGVFGDPTETGKAVGNDIREGKKTLLLQRAYRSASAKDQAFLSEICGRDISEAELHHAQQIITASGSLQYSQHLATQKVETALQSIEGLTLSESGVEAQSVLTQLAQFVAQRKK